MNEIKCPCGSAAIERIHGPDELSWTVKDTEMKELWQCMDCGGYLALYYELKRAVPLVEVLEY